MIKNIFLYTLRYISIVYIISVMVYTTFVHYGFNMFSYSDLDGPLFIYEKDFTIFIPIFWHVVAIIAIVIMQSPGWLVLWFTYRMLRVKNSIQIPLYVILQVPVSWVYIFYTTYVNAMIYISTVDIFVEQDYVFFGTDDAYQIHYIIPWVFFYIVILAPGVISLLLRYRLREKFTEIWQRINFVICLYIVITAAGVTGYIWLLDRKSVV